MKNIRYYIIILACTLMGAVSCSLDEASYTEVAKDEYMKTASEAETVLLGVYRNLTTEGLYRYHLSLYFTIPTDIAKVTGNSLDNFRNVPCNAYTSTEDEVQVTWQALYSAIYTANDFIERLSVAYEDYSEEDRKLAAIYMAEARSLRALFYFELVRWFGNVALMTSTVQSSQHPSTFFQSAPEDVYEFIEQDLLYAIEVLPYASDDTYRSDNSYRFSKGAALGLLTKVYATWAGYPLYDETKWEKAAKTAKILISSGKHSLLPDYEQLWKNTCNGRWDPSESLIEVSFYSPTITGNSAYDASGRIGKWNGVSAADGSIRAIRMASNWRVIPTFLAGWKDYSKDLRWAISFADYKYTLDGKVAIMTYKDKNDGNVTKDGNFEMAMQEGADAGWRNPYKENICPAKWDIEKYVEDDNILMDANMSNVNWYILRYSDVLLLYAEAMNEWKKGPTSDAYAAVNMVRRRGFGQSVNATSSSADLQTGMDYAQFQQAIRDERSYELAFEGHRRQDLIRWGIYYEAIMDTFQDMVGWHEQAPDYYLPASYTKKNKNELLPIPQRDMDLMPLFKQNPGW